MPYIYLALLGLVPAALRIARRRDGALLATAFTAAGLCDLADWIAFSILDLYRYQPGLSRNSVMDGTLGVILAEFIFVGSLSALVVGRTPRWVWAGVGAAVVTVVELIFTRTGLLVLNGWTPWLNVAGFLVFFWLIDTYHDAATRFGLRHGWPLLITRVGVVTMFAELYALIQKVANAFVMYISVLPTHARNQSFGRLMLNLAFVIPLGVWVLHGRWLNRTGRILVATMVSIVFNYVRVAVHFQRFRAPWSPVSDGLFLGLTLGAAALADDWIRAWADDRRETEARPTVY